MGAAQRIRGYSDLVGLVYDGVEEPKPWKSLMSRLSAQAEAHDASLLIAAPSIPGAFYLVTDNEDPVATATAHINGVMSVNVFFDMPQPRATSPDELMPDGGFLRTALYQQFLKPLNIRHLLGRDVLRSDALCAKLALERTVEQGPFSGRERELLELISPHMQRAIRLREQRSHGCYMQCFFEEAMAKLSIACLLIDGYGRVASMNACARGLLENTDVLSVRGGVLRCSPAVDGKRLTKAVELALAANRNGCRSQRGTGLQLETSPGNGVFDVVVKPLVGDGVLESRDRPAAVVYINDCRQPGIELDPAVLGGMYGFTQCESRLAARLARGTTLNDAAAQLGVSINTVKTHLRGIYEKMGTNKQAQVVALLNHSTARLL